MVELSITDPPPPDVAADLAALRAALDLEIPRKQLDRNLLIATWNIRSFGSLTKKWTSGSSDSPKRDYRGLLAIAEVVSRFDVVAVQEVTGDLRALRYLIQALERLSAGPHWSFLMTDVTLGKDGHAERMAFVFDRRRVDLSGMACELVVPPEKLAEIAPDALQRQFARTPYAVSFRSGDATFILVTLHVTYGDDSAGRIPELRAIAEWMGEWAERTSRWHQNLIALGDFNIDRHEDQLWQAFSATGLTVPAALHGVPRSIFADAADPLSRYYDQIAWFNAEADVPALDLELSRAGGFDFLPHVYRGLGLSKNSLSFRLSDHYPLWTEFVLRP